jgi:hypothetical protein
VFWLTAKPGVSAALPQARSRMLRRLEQEVGERID